MPDQDQPSNTAHASQPETHGAASGQHVSDQAKAAGKAVKDEYDRLRDKAVEGGRAAMHDARDQAEAYADDWRSDAAGNVAVVADALRAGARTLDENGSPLASYSDTAARGVDELAHWMQDKSWSEIWQQSESYARQQPLVAFGGALTAGFLLARFLKSSGDVSSPREPPMTRGTQQPAQVGGVSPSAQTGPDPRTGGTHQ